MDTKQLVPLPTSKPDNGNNEVMSEQQINENSLSFKELHLDILTSLYPSALTLREFEDRKNSIAAELRSRGKEDRNMKLDINDRANMVNWMLQVTAIFECTRLTYFRTLNIIDQFYVKTRG